MYDAREGEGSGAVGNANVLTRPMIPLAAGLPDLVSFPAALAGHSQSWSLDALGNWSSSTTDGTTTTRANNSQNQIHAVGGSTLAYDANGNTLTDETGQHYTYDAWNHIVSATNAAAAPIAAYTYDAAGHRITESANGTTTDLYLSNQWQVLEERQGGTPTAQYVWGLGYVDSLVERDTHTPASSGTALDKRLYAQQDANYNVTAVTDSTGAVVDRWVYDPYGKATQLDANSWAPGGTDLGWVYLHQGGRLEAATGLDYFRNRDYAPSQGRWIERDPATMFFRNVGSYATEASNPVAMDDQSGLSPTTTSAPATRPTGSAWWDLANAIPSLDWPEISRLGDQAKDSGIVPGSGNPVCDISKLHIVVRHLGKGAFFKHSIGKTDIPYKELGIPLPGAAQTIGSKGFEYQWYLSLMTLTRLVSDAKQDTSGYRMSASVTDTKTFSDKPPTTKEIPNDWGYDNTPYRLGHNLNSGYAWGPNWNIDNPTWSATSDSIPTFLSRKMVWKVRVEDGAGKTIAGLSATYSFQFSVNWNAADYEKSAVTWDVWPNGFNQDFVDPKEEH